MAITPTEAAAISSIATALGMFAFGHRSKGDVDSHHTVAKWTIRGIAAVVALVAVAVTGVADAGVHLALSEYHHYAGIRTSTHTASNGRKRYVVVAGQEKASRVQRDAANVERHHRWPRHY